MCFATHITQIESPLSNLPLTNASLADSMHAWQIKTYALQTGSVDSEKIHFYLSLPGRVSLPKIMKKDHQGIVYLP
jgi:hypothetical protein